MEVAVACKALLDVSGGRTRYVLPARGLPVTLLYWLGAHRLNIWTLVYSYHLVVIGHCNSIVGGRVYFGRCVRNRPATQRVAGCQKVCWLEARTASRPLLTRHV